MVHGIRGQHVHSLGDGFGTAILFGSLAQHHRPGLVLSVGFAVPPAVALRPLAAKSNGYITFGSLNKLVKASPSALRLWSDVLKAVPRSRLMLLGPSDNPELIDRLAQLGIALHRIQLMPRRPRLQYLDLFNRIDIALDPFPYNGETTTCDGFWMGVPLVTLAGDSLVSRRGVSLLSNVGLTELVAQTPAEYVSIAAGLAGNFDSLSELRSGLRRRMRESAITDGGAYTRELEGAYRKAWRAWSMGLDRPIAKPG